MNFANFLPPPKIGGGNLRKVLEILSSGIIENPIEADVHDKPYKIIRGVICFNY